MKKKKKSTLIYFLIPLVGLTLFGAYYYKFISEYDAKQAEKAQAIKHMKEQELLAQNALRDKAIKDAVAQAEQRKAERKAKDEHDRKQREDRENAIQARNKVGTEAEKLQRQAERLAKDIATVKEEITKIEAEKARAVAEQAFLKTYVSKAKDTTKELSKVLDRIAEADDAAVRAEAAARAAAAKKS